MALVTALALLLIAMNQLTGMIQQGLFLSRSLQEREDLESIRHHLRQSLDCNATIAALGSSCAVGSQIALRKWGGSDLIRKESPTTRVSHYFLRAQCTAVVREFDVQWSRDEKNWRELFGPMAADKLTCP